VVSRAAKLLGYRLCRDRSRTSCRPRQRWVGSFSACVPPVPEACGVTQKRCENKTQSRNVLRARRWQKSDRNGGMRA
jgi:hypothetical protein